MKVFTLEDGFQMLFAGGCMGYGLAAAISGQSGVAAFNWLAAGVNVAVVLMRREALQP